jgi:hypothetical protein
VDKGGSCLLPVAGDITAHTGFPRGKDSSHARGWGIDRDENKKRTNWITIHTSKLVRGTLRYDWMDEKLQNADTEEAVWRGA